MYVSGKRGESQSGADIFTVILGKQTTMKDFLNKKIASAPVITQFSTIDALMAGVYDGFATIGELKAAGDTAIGTLDKLDGEMIMIGGDVWCVHADGTATNGI